MSDNIQKQCMLEAIELARQAGKNGEMPVGAVIYCNDTQKIISRAANMVETEHNPVKHAEIIAIEQACDFVKEKTLNSCDLFVTLEPCMMCAAAISYAKIKRLYYAAPNHKFGAVETFTRYFTESNCNHRPEIYPMLFEEYSEKILKNFFYRLRI